MNIECVSCKKAFEPAEDISCTPCGHIFHSTCINQSIKRSKLCPECPRKVSQDNVRRLFLNVSTENKENLKSQIKNLNTEVSLKETDIINREFQLMYLQAVLDRRETIKNLHGNILSLTEKIMDAKDLKKESLQEEFAVNESVRFELARKLQSYEDEKNAASKSSNSSVTVVKASKETTLRRSLRLKNKLKDSCVAKKVKLINKKSLILYAQNHDECSLNEKYFPKIANLTKESEEISPCIRQKLEEISVLKEYLANL